MTKTTHYVKGLVTLAVMVASLLAMPDIAHAYQVHVSISGAGLVTETTPANLLQACSSPPTTPTGVIARRLLRGDSRRRLRLGVGGALRGNAGPRLQLRPMAK